MIELPAIDGPLGPQTRCWMACPAAQLQRPPMSDAELAAEWKDVSDRPLSALDILGRDRDEWKKRASKAEHESRELRDRLENLEGAYEALVSCSGPGTHEDLP